ncbi:FMRFamide receptor, partial [Orchesella cincta]
LLHKDTPSTSYKYLLQGLTLSDFFLLTISTVRTLGNLHIMNPNNQNFQTLIFFWDWICTSGTKYFTVAISFERFCVVTFPLKAHRLITPGRSKLFAIFVLIFVILLSCLSYIYVNYIDATSFNVYAAIVLHFTPFITVLIFNLLIFLALRRFKKMRKSLTESSSSNSKEDSATPMLFAVVVVFGVCYTFEFIRRIMNFAWPEYMSQHEYYDYTINHLADILYVLNSSVNFFIYCLLGKSFRAVIVKVLNSVGCGIITKIWGRKEVQGKLGSLSDASTVSYAKSSTTVSAA